MSYSHNRSNRCLSPMGCLFAVVMLVSACGPSSDDRVATGSDNGGDGSGSGTSLSLAGTWDLVSLDVDGEPVPVPDRPIQIEIADGVIGGQAGCNRFSGPIERGDDGSLSLGPLAATEMACELLDFEEIYMRALIGVTSWEGSPDGVAFVSDNARITYRFHVVEPPIAAPLAGTVWVLNSIYEPGDGPERAVSSIDLGAPGVEMTIEADIVTLRSTTCSDTQYELESAETADNGPFMVNGGGAVDCEGSESDNVNHYVASQALVGATGYMIDNDRLTLIGEEGELVGFVASGDPAGE